MKMVSKLRKHKAPFEVFLAQNNHIAFVQSGKIIGEQASPQLPATQVWFDDIEDKDLQEFCPENYRQCAKTHKVYEFKVYPSAKQVERFETWLDICRGLWNQMVAAAYDDIHTDYYNWVDKNAYKMICEPIKQAHKEQIAQLKAQKVPKSEWPELQLPPDPTPVERIRIKSWAKKSPWVLPWDDSGFGHIFEEPKVPAPSRLPYKGSLALRLTSRFSKSNLLAEWDSWPEQAKAWITKEKLIDIPQRFVTGLANSVAGAFDAWKDVKLKQRHQPRFKSRYRELDKVTSLISNQGDQVSVSPINGSKNGIIEAFKERFWVKGLMDRLPQNVLHNPEIIRSFKLLKKPTGWFLQLTLLKIEFREMLTGNVVGIDPGLKYVLSDSHGKQIDPPKYYRNSQEKRETLGQKIAYKRQVNLINKIQSMSLSEFTENIRRGFPGHLAQKLITEKPKTWDDLKLLIREYTEQEMAGAKAVDIAKRISRYQGMLLSKSFLPNSKRMLRLESTLKRMGEVEKRQRKSFNHKITTDIVRENDVICLEDISPLNLSRRCKPKQDAETGAYLPNNQSSQSGRAKSFADNGLGQIREMLSNKIKAYPRKILQLVPPAYTTINCSECGAKVEKSLSTRTHICPECGLILDRDLNAALNILKKGLDLLSSPQEIKTEKLDKTVEVSHTVKVEVKQLTDHPATCRREVKARRKRREGLRPQWGDAPPNTTLNLDCGTNRVFFEGSTLKEGKPLHSEDFKQLTLFESSANPETPDSKELEAVSKNGKHKPRTLKSQNTSPHPQTTPEQLDIPGL